MKTATQTNTELNLIVELYEAKVAESLVSKSALKDVTLSAEEALLLESISLNYGSYRQVVSFATKLILTAGVKELPLTVLISQVAETMCKAYKPSTRFRISAIIIKSIEEIGMFTIFNKINKHGFSERIVNLSISLTSQSQSDLKSKLRNLPTEAPQKATKSMAGHSKKIKADNSHMLGLTQKLNDVGYTLDKRVWELYGARLAAYRFSDMATQQAMLEEGDKLLGKTFYFGHRFGPDNGRIYCDGDLFTLHGGALNYAYKFADKRILTKQGLEVLRAKVNELHAAEKLSFKEEVEMYSLTLDLLDAEKGLPVGTILHIDAKLSGLQHQSIALRDADGAYYCGLLADMSDGYTHIRNNLSNSEKLTRDMVKKGFNPYQYGAGMQATLNPVRELGGDLDYKEWEAAYKKAFPAAFELRQMLLSISKHYKEETYSYTTPSGFKAVLTALDTVETAITCVYGKLTYARKEIDKEFMGVKLVAAFSHMLDASVLHYVLAKSNFDLHLVHDSFGAHPNDVAKVEALYVQAMQENLASNILEDFLSDILSVNGALVTANASRLIRNTLTPSMVVGGLY